MVLGMIKAWPEKEKRGGAVFTLLPCAQCKEGYTLKEVWLGQFAGRGGGESKLFGFKEECEVKGRWGSVNQGGGTKLKHVGSLGKEKGQGNSQIQGWWWNMTILNGIEDTDVSRMGGGGGVR